MKERERDATTTLQANSKVVGASWTRL